MRPPVPGCTGIVGNESATGRKSSFVSEMSHSLSSPLSTSGTVTSPTLRKSGFLQEPDGCTSNTELCLEGCKSGSSKMDSLICLLNDRCGITYFRQFLSTKHACDALEFWLACMGHRKSDTAKCSSIAMVIYKKFIAPTSNRVHLTSTTRRAIKERLKSGNIDSALFDSAVGEVETFLLRHHYPLFLESDEHAEYVRTRSANRSPSSDSSSDHSGSHNQLQAAEMADRQDCDKERSCRDDLSDSRVPEDQKNETTCNFRFTGDCTSHTGYVLLIFFLS